MKLGIGILDLELMNWDLIMGLWTLDLELGTWDFLFGTLDSGLRTQDLGHRT